MRRAIGACVRSLRVRPCRCATSLKRLWTVPWSAANFWRVFVHRNGSLARSLCWGVRRELTSQNGSAAWSWANGQRGLASARLVWADKAGISGSGFSESPDARQGVCIDNVVARPISNLGLAAAASAGLEKRVSMHTLRHSFATHLLERKTDVRVIRSLLGHSKLDTTGRYTRVAIKALGAVKSPLSHLRPPTA